MLSSLKFFLMIRFDNDQIEWVRINAKILGSLLP
jgi:hypothetical protein